MNGEFNYYERAEIIYSHVFFKYQIILCDGCSVIHILHE